MAKKLWAGLDVGVETTRVCVMDDDGEVLHEATCRTDVKSVHREIAFLRRRRFARVGIETGTGMHLARGLRTLRYSVDIYEARQLNKFLRMRRNKTDAGDAAGIAEVGRLGAATIAKVYLKSLDCQALQSRLAIRRRLIRLRVTAVNTLCRHLEQFGGRISSCTSPALLRNRVETEIRKLFGSGPNALVSDLRYLLDLSERLLVNQSATDSALERLARENEVCCRFMEIPGVGPICALTFYAVVGEPHRFERSSDIGSYLGLAPRIHQSGLMCRTGRITKMGNRTARSLLVQSSVHFMRFSTRNSQLHAWALQVEQRRGRGRARVALARKLATIMLSMWKSGASFQPRPLTPEPCT
jgi:transposase